MQCKAYSDMISVSVALRPGKVDTDVRQHDLETRASIAELFVDATRLEGNRRRIYDPK